MQHNQVLPMDFEEWKMRYRKRVAEVCGIKPERFDETLIMIADDECLLEVYQDRMDPDEAADEEMSYWSE